MLSTNNLENNTQEYEQAMRVSSAFYNRYKSLCHGTSRRHELKRLYEDTQPVILKLTGDTKPLRFSQILYALSNTHNVLKVLGGNEIQWTVFNKSFNKYKLHPERIEKQPNNFDLEEEQEPLWNTYDIFSNPMTLETYSLQTHDYTDSGLYKEEFLPLGEFYTITNDM
jgi:hypothetical protein